MPNIEQSMEPKGKHPGGRPSKYKPCPFCGGECDPKGWLQNNGLKGPECKRCGSTAPSIKIWEMRIDGSTQR